MHVESSAACDADAGEIYLDQSPGKVGSIETCKSLCEKNADCQSITHFNSGWCSHFSTPCTKTTWSKKSVSMRLSKGATSASTTKVAASTSTNQGAASTGTTKGAASTTTPEPNLSTGQFYCECSDCSCNTHVLRTLACISSQTRTRLHPIQCRTRCCEPSPHAETHTFNR